MTGTDRPTTVVTGANGAIGSAIVARLLRDGRNVVAVDLRPPQTLQPDPDGRITRIEADVADEFAWAEIADRLAGTPLAGLVTVAAINRTGPVSSYSVADWDAMMAVNVRGVFLAIRACVPRMTAGAAIVNLSSVSAFIGSNGASAYHTTKGAIVSLSRSLAQELAGQGIRVNSVCPGWVDTPFTTAYLSAQPDPAAARAQAERLHAMGRMASPEEVAQCVAFLLSTEAGFVTGTELFVDGGFMIHR